MLRWIRARYRLRLLKEQTFLVAEVSRLAGEVGDTFALANRLGLASGSEADHAEEIARESLDLVSVMRQLQMKIDLGEALSSDEFAMLLKLHRRLMHIKTTMEEGRALARKHFGVAN